MKTSGSVPEIQLFCSWTSIETFITLCRKLEGTKPVIEFLSIYISDMYLCDEKEGSVPLIPPFDFWSDKSRYSK